MVKGFYKKNLGQIYKAIWHHHTEVLVGNTSVSTSVVPTSVSVGKPALLEYLHITASLPCLEPAVALNFTSMFLRKVSRKYAKPSGITGENASRNVE